MSFRLMGPGKALEVFALERVLTASEAEAYGLVTRVFPRQEFEQKTKALTEILAKMPRQVFKH